MHKRISILIATLAITLALAQPAYAAWLSGWDKRVKLTICYQDIGMADII